MSKLPYFKFFPGDWLAGTSLMSPAEKGGYIDLLGHQWKHGGLPDNIDTLNQLSGLYPGRYPGISAVSLMVYFPVDTEDGLRKNEKLEDIRKEITKTSDAQRDRIAKRWHKNDTPVYTPVDTPVIPSQKLESRLNKKKINKKNETVFIPPTITEVQEYFNANDISISPWEFIRWYETAEWKDVNGKQVKNWKLKSLSWEKRDKEKAKQSKPKLETKLSVIESRYQ